MRGLGLVLLLVVAASCSGGDDTTATDAGTAVVSSTDVPAKPDADVTADERTSPAPTQPLVVPTSTTPATVPPTTAAPTTTTTTFPSIAAELGLGTIEQLTDTTGVGRRPVLRWARVDGATRYHVFVLSPSDVVYWGWQTTETSAPLGGPPQLPDSAPGPAISAGMTWSVSAVDDEGQIIAISAKRPISP